ncbi:hypothetical protein JCM2811A_29650 [Methylorubrum rhodinum]
MRLTAEFEMGSGPGHTAQATRPAQHKVFVTLGFGKQDRRRVPAVVFIVLVWRLTASAWQRLPVSLGHGS